MLSFNKLKKNYTVKDSLVVTKSLITKFANLTKDFNPIHSENKYSRSTYLRGPIVHGFSYAIFFSKLVGNKICKDPIIWLEQSFSFKKKVTIGDKLTLYCKIKKINTRYRIIDIQCEGFNQVNQKVISGTGQLKCLEKKISLKKTTNNKTKTALIIGGTRGIGFQILKDLTSLNYNVCFTYKNSEIKAKKICKKYNNVVGIKIDYNNQNIQYIKNYVKKIFKSNINILIISASEKISQNKLFENDFSSIQNSIDFNLKSTFEICKDIIKDMRKEKFGRVIAIGSTLTEKPVKNFGSYIIGKQNLKTLIKLMSLEYANENITFNSVSPHFTDTELLSTIMDENEIIIEQIKNPLNRLANPSDISECVKFLCSNESSYINGQNIVISGGAV